MAIMNMIRIMRHTFSLHAKISNDAKEIVQGYVSEYISFVTREANDCCHMEQRKIISAEDVIWVMSKLGFNNHVEPFNIFLLGYRNSENERSSAQKEPNARHVRVMEYGPFGIDSAGGSSS
ncbi:hypothetical protein EZV62_008097 [Acer yangbiense]|uniref:Transcription factor CBF/NF-Y/archaeal histone domain-containing protein n=1 Tax=Acer yangbiense TaxID=1000413 RepID=A0A5C7IDA5_9ROSI|nr:hypothetical protein EZV62_008097 [Acer yangbiense]